MKINIAVLLFALPIMSFAQLDSIKPVNFIAAFFGSKGDTIINLNSLNNGIKSYQVSKESKAVISSNGLEINDGGIILIKEDSLFRKDFQFDVKTFSSDKEWYENTIKVKVNPSMHYIILVSITSDKIEMATGFRKEGKIYVVVSVSMILFGVIILYLIFMERKVRKLEKMLKDK